MKKELFIEYKNMVSRCIASCINMVQLQVAFDMKYRFEDRFTALIPISELSEAVEELHQEYLNKHAQLYIS